MQTNIWSSACRIYFFWAYINFFLASQRAYTYVICQKIGSFCANSSLKFFDISHTLCGWWNISRKIVGKSRVIFPQKIQLNPGLDTPLPWIVSRLQIMPCARDFSWLLGSMRLKLSTSSGRRSLRRNTVGSSPILASLLRQLATLLTVEPGESCSSSTSPPCLGSSGSSPRASLPTSSGTFTESSLPGCLLKALKVPSSEGLQDRKCFLSSLTSGWLTLWPWSDWSSAKIWKKKKENQ